MLLDAKTKLADGKVDSFEAAIGSWNNFYSYLSSDTRRLSSRNVVNFTATTKLKNREKMRWKRKREKKEEVIIIIKRAKTKKTENKSGWEKSFVEARNVNLNYSCMVHGIEFLSALHWRKFTRIFFYIYPRFVKESCLGFNEYGRPWAMRIII